MNETIAIDIFTTDVVSVSASSKSSTHCLDDTNSFDDAGQRPFLKLVKNFIFKKRTKMQIILYFIYKVKNRRYVTKKVCTGQKNPKRLNCTCSDTPCMSSYTSPLFLTLCVKYSIICIFPLFLVFNKFM
jgi:hypothetical protein